MLHTCYMHVMCMLHACLFPRMLQQKKTRHHPRRAVQKSSDKSAPKASALPRPTNAPNNGTSNAKFSMQLGGVRRFFSVSSDVPPDQERNFISPVLSDAREPDSVK